MTDITYDSLVADLRDLYSRVLKKSDDLDRMKRHLASLDDDIQVFRLSLADYCLSYRFVPEHYQTPVSMRDPLMF